MLNRPVEGVPVATIDGPSGSGKGTLAVLLARELGWHYLDSGALYRAVAWAAFRKGIEIEPREAETLGRLARRLELHYEPDGPNGVARIRVNGEAVGPALRSQEISDAASKVAAMQPVRDGLLELQRSFRQPPGLVADGRDMATVVFPDAPIQIFLSADLEERARRRYQQLRGEGVDVTFEQIREELHQRDERDTQRFMAPLKPSPRAYVLDTTEMPLGTVLAEVLHWVHERLQEAK